MKVRETNLCDNVIILHLLLIFSSIKLFLTNGDALRYMYPGEGISFELVVIIIDVRSDINEPSEPSG